MNASCEDMKRHCSGMVPMNELATEELELVATCGRGQSPGRLSTVVGVVLRKRDLAAVPPLCIYPKNWKTKAG